nr:MAP protein [Ipomoea batatas]
MIALSALVIYVTRVGLGYKQTWDRYQVNPASLLSKLLASGFDSIHFLLDASEQQQYKQTILAYAILLKIEK